jgi:flagellar protein FliO/FliZ
MFETLFGAEMPLPVRFFIAFLFVLGLIGATAWIVRRFGGERLGAATARGRQPRLAVIDAATVDTRRRLILIRRDNVEHLLMIGGPTDVVIEPNIVRAVAATRESPAPSRAPATTDTLPRAVPLGDAGMWPLQPEPAPVPRPQRPSVPEEPVQWSVEPELPPQPAPRRQPRPIDPLAGLAAEVARLPEPPRAPMPADPGGPASFVPREPARQREPVREREPQIEREPVRDREPVREREPMREREPVREREAMREPVREREPARMREPAPPPAVPDPDFNANADQNLADMAQRLEAALRRPAKTNEPRSAEPPPRAITAEMDSAPQIHPRPAAPPPSETSPMRADPKPAKSLYDSLEKEMANLLGRPSGKS